MKLAFQIPRLSLLWILASLVVIVLPQAFRLPWWVTGISILCVVWRLAVFSGRIAYPATSIRASLVLLAIVLTAWQYVGVGIGLDAAISVLVLGTFFKTLEMREKRDIAIVICLSYVLIMAGFIYSQTILTGVHALLAMMITTGSLISVSRDNAHNTLAHNTRLSMRIILQAIPVTIILFIFVPRIAPLWTMPQPSPGSTTGVSDEMSPGDISSLGRSADLAFRVSFDGDAPSHDQLYWRGLVLDDFDGRAWTRSRSSFALARRLANEPVDLEIATQGLPISYDVILEPTQQNWLYAMPLADFDSTDIFRDSNFSLYLRNPITQRYRYQMRAFLQYQSASELREYSRRINLALPEQDANVLSRDFAENLRAQSGDDRDYINAVLNNFRQQEFYYTLTPGLLGQASVDEFLFSSRDGFCEHYASSFVYLMRAAGIPSRVVVGYQGGEYNPYEDYTMVYQYNAHAWAEVWLEGEGWVRVDPTAAVAPERINLGVEAYFANQPGFLEESGFSMLRFRDNAWINSLRLRLDALDYAWNRWVVSYDEDLQLSFLEGLLGDGVKKRLVWILVGSTSVVFGLLAFFVLRGGARVRYDKATQMYLGATANLQKIGLTRGRGEGPRDYAERVALARPDLAVSIRELTELYMQLNYHHQEHEPMARAELMKKLTKQAHSIRLLVATGLKGFMMRVTRR
jgi:transglutaminase-like putative cysteine protease